MIWHGDLRKVISQVSSVEQCAKLFKMIGINLFSVWLDVLIYCIAHFVAHLEEFFETWT